MIVRSLLFIAALLMVAPAYAEPVDFVGEWREDGSRTLDVSVRRGTRDPSFLATTVTVAMPGCVGQVEVFGKPEPGAASMMAESYTPNEPAAPICRLSLERTGPDTLRVVERDGCGYFHGFACDFSGTATRTGVAQ